MRAPWIGVIFYSFRFLKTHNKIQSFISMVLRDVCVCVKCTNISSIIRVENSINTMCCYKIIDNNALVLD